METDICRRCKKETSVLDFYSAPNTKKGRKTICKNCVKNVATDSYKRNYRNKRERAASEGMCQACFKSPARDGMYSCQACADRIQECKKRTKDPSKAREYQYIRKYGMTIADYDFMLEFQGGRCAICRTDSPGQHGRFVVDHCHDSGKVRGLLCWMCNSAIGHLRHDPDVIRRAAEYLEST